ncbi:MAG: ribonuclease Z [Thermoleophilaceae bacterium]
MDLDVVFLGTAGSAPTARRGLPATLIRRGGERLLFDCGEGTQRQMIRSIGLVDVDEVFITHFHADHVLGLPGMLKTFGLHGRERPITVYGPAGLETLFRVLAPLIGKTGYHVRIEELESGDDLDGDGYAISAFSVAHRVPALGYALVEDPRPGRFDERRAIELGVKPGPDFGRLQGGETVAGTDGDVSPDQVLGEERAGRRIVITGDTAPCDMTRAIADRADLLVHEATFMHEDLARARETGHSTARQAAMLAAEAQVRLLALTHISSRYGAGPLRDEARAELDRTIVPRDFDRVEVPFPERGEPVHERGPDG